MNTKIKYLVGSISMIIVFGIILAMISLTPYTWAELDASSAAEKFGAPLPPAGSEFSVLVHPRQKIATCEITESDFVKWAIQHKLDLLPLSASKLRVFREVTALDDSRLVNQGYYAEFDSVSVVFEQQTERASFSNMHDG